MYKKNPQEAKAKSESMSPANHLDLHPAGIFRIYTQLFHNVKC